ncbi:MAG: FkbM family methyltransferase [Pseudomonadota bacterium]
MNLQPRKRLFSKLSQKGFKPKHVAEVGVYHPETSNVYDYVMQGVRTTFVEPDPGSIAKIHEHFAGRDNITLHEVATFDSNGPLELVQRAASTFVSTLPASPAMVNDGYVTEAQDKFTVDGVTFDRIDDGTIDLISIDIEGSEWFVLKHMTSEPAVISVETHGAAYLNPYLTEIEDWMVQRGYVVFFKDGTDSVYVKPDVVRLSAMDSLQLALKNLYLGYRRKKKRLLARPAS